MRQLLLACAVGVFPFFAANVGIIMFHKGSIIHMSKLEWAVFAIVSSGALLLVLAAVLSLLVFVSGGKRWLFVLLSGVLLYGLPPFIEPHFWSWEFWSLDPTEEPSVWLFVGVSLSTLAALLFTTSRAQLAGHRRGGGG